MAAGPATLPVLEDFDEVWITIKTGRIAVRMMSISVAYALRSAARYRRFGTKGINWPQALVLALMAGLLGSATAARAEAADDSTSVQLQEMVVTAEKRSERLLDVPLSVTAVTSAEIESRGITNLEQMQYAVPGLTIAQSGPGTGLMQLDGISSAAGGTSGLPTVGVYLDEMPVTGEGAAVGAIDVRLLDIERIEVLHGPQPTLYGEGSEGGTIHYVTNSPDLHSWSGDYDGMVGGVTDGSTSYWARGVVNAPLIDGQLGLRIAAGYERDGGWIDSLVTGRPDVNDVDIKTIRAKMLYTPVDKLSVSLMYMHQQHDQDYQDYGNPDTRTTNALYPPYNNERYDLGNLIASYDFGFASLLSSTGYLHRDPANAVDVSAYLSPYLPLFGVAPGAITTIALPLEAPQNMTSEELRLTSNGASPVGYTVGAYYRDYRTHSEESTYTAPGVLPFTLIGSDTRSRDQSWAVFAEARYAITQQLQALIGLRHYQDQQDIAGSETTFGAPTPIATGGTFTSNNPRFNLSYKTSDHGLVYANVAKGFRSGGVNFASEGPGVPLSYGPESLWTYQLGAKQTWMDGRVSLDAMGYYNEWSDIQSTGVTPLGLSYTGNGGKASGPGANLALAAKPASELTVAATVGYTDMKYDVDTPDRHEGDPLDLVAKWTWSTVADYRRPLGRSALVAHADLGHTSGFQITVRSLIPPAILHSDDRTVLNARIGADFGRFAAYVFGSNLTDNRGILYPALGAVSEPTLPTPRTVGVELKGHF
jgi:iron complex outermembrane receptor protein